MSDEQLDKLKRGEAQAVPFWLPANDAAKLAAAIEARGDSAFKLTDAVLEAVYATWLQQPKDKQ